MARCGHDLSLVKRRRAASTNILDLSREFSSFWHRKVDRAVPAELSLATFGRPGLRPPVRSTPSTFGVPVGGSVTRAGSRSRPQRNASGPPHPPWTRPCLATDQSGQCPQGVIDRPFSPGRARNHAGAATLRWEHRLGVRRQRMRFCASHSAARRIQRRAVHAIQAPRAWYSGRSTGSRAVHQRRYGSQGSLLDCVRPAAA